MTAGVRSEATGSKNSAVQETSGVRSSTSPTSSETVKTGGGAFPLAKPWVTIQCGAPNPAPRPNKFLIAIGYVARVMAVGVVASFNVNVPAVVEPSSFLAVSVTPAIENSLSKATVR